MMLQIDFALAVAFLTVVVAASVRGVLGLGFALIVVPIFQLFVPGAVPVVVLLLTLPLSIWMVIRERRELDLRGLGHVALGRLIGTVPGVVIVAHFPPAQLSVFVGVSLLVAAMLSLVRNSGRSSTGKTRFMAGLAAGTVGTVAAVGGPILAFAYRGRPGPELRSTLSGVFIIGQVLSIGGLAIAGQVHGVHVVYALALVPALVLGMGVSRTLIPLVDRQRLAYGIVALASLAGVSAIVRGLRG